MVERKAKMLAPNTEELGPVFSPEGNCMPELAAHPERVARNLAERVDKLMDAADHLVWATEIEIQGGPRTRSFILQHRAKCRYNVEQTKKAMAALTGEQNGVAAALAACAREERLDEAKWWNDGQHGSHQVSEGSYKCHKCLRIMALERAVGEKAPMTATEVAMREYQGQTLERLARQITHSLIDGGLVTNEQSNGVFQIVLSALSLRTVRGAGPEGNSRA